MAHYIDDDLTLEHGKRVAYRTIDTTIKVSTSWVGPPVQMAVCDENGVHILDTDEIAELGVAVEGWKQLEAETLRMDPKQAAETASHDLPSIDDAAVPHQVAHQPDVVGPTDTSLGGADA